MCLRARTTTPCVFAYAPALHTASIGFAVGLVSVIVGISTIPANVEIWRMNLAEATRSAT